MANKNTSYDFVIFEINNLQSELNKQNINIHYELQKFLILI